MFCANCGNELQEKDKFCSQCGAKVDLKETEVESIDQQDTKGMPPVEVCETCNDVKRIIYQKEIYTGKQICIKCEATAGVCPVCGNKLRSEKAQQCPKCFASWHATPQKHIPTPPEKPKDDVLRCEKCNSENITAHKKGFGVGKALVGGVLTGGVGLLGGFIGSKKIYLTCLKCGHKWKPGK